MTDAPGYEAATTNARAGFISDSLTPGTSDGLICRRCHQSAGAAKERLQADQRRARYAENHAHRTRRAVPRVWRTRRAAY